MTFTYRFELPAARGISGPNLGLQYNSSTRDREAGYGWGLDPPSIELRPLAGLARFDGNGAPLPIDRERYVFQGQSLVRICVVGGACPEEPSTQGHPGWATGLTYYRAHVEGLFARFYRSADRHTWRVQFKGGEVVDFGAAAGESYGMPPAFEQASGGGIVRWHPVIRRDSQHPNNVVLYKWQLYGARGLLYLTDIYDTPALSAPHHGRLVRASHAAELGRAPVPRRQLPEPGARDAGLSTGARGRREHAVVRRRPARDLSLVHARLLRPSGRGSVRSFDARAAAGTTRF